MYKIVRNAAIELSVLDSGQTIKVAGVLRRLKNVFKQLTDRQFSDQVDKIRDESLTLQSVADHLNKKIDELLSSIKDGDVASYEAALDEVKDLSIELSKELKQLNEAAKDGKEEVAENAAQTPTTPQSPVAPQESDERGWDGRYGPETWSNRRHEFMKKLKEQRQDHDVPISENMNRHLSEFAWFKDAEFVIPPGSKETILRKITAALFNNLTINPDLAADVLEKNWGQFAMSASEAIRQGTIFRYSAAKPSGEVRRKMGEAHFLASCKTFELPGLDVTLSARFKVTDLGLTTTDSKVLNISNIDSIVVKRKNKADRLDKLRKLAYANLQPKTIKKIDELGLAKALAEGYQKVYGTAPSLEVLGVAWSQAVFERSPSLGLPNYNIGNIRASGDWIKSGKPYFTEKTIEIDKEGKAVQDQGAKWRAYPTAADGAAGYWQLLGGRYKDAVNWMEAGDAVSAAVVLGEKGYYTANIEKYSSNVGKIYQTFQKRIAPQLPMLKSAPKPPPAPVKPAAVDKRFSPTVKTPAVDTSQTNPQEADKLLGALFAMGPVERMVAKSILQRKLPTTTTVISLSSLSAPYGIRMKFAKSVSTTLAEIIDADVSIHSDGNKIELQCSVLGSEYAVMSAVKALCDCVNVALYEKTKTAGKYSVGCYLSPSVISKYAKLEV